MDRPRLERQLAGGLRSQIDAHGAIRPEWIGSAARRLLAQLYKGDAELRRALNAEQLIVGECRICGWPLRPPDNPGELRSGGAGLE